MSNHHYLVNKETHCLFSQAQWLKWSSSSFFIKNISEPDKKSFPYKCKKENSTLVFQVMIQENIRLCGVGCVLEFLSDASRNQQIFSIR